jgi:hypothetical protein
MSTKNINTLRQETLHNIEAFKEANIISKTQYDILIKRYDKIKDTNRKKVYEDITNRLNAFIASNTLEKSRTKLLDQMPININDQPTKLSREERLGKHLDSISKVKGETVTKDQASKYLRRSVKDAINGAFQEITIDGETEKLTQDVDYIIDKKKVGTMAVVNTNKVNNILKRELLEIFLTSNFSTKINLFSNGLVKFTMKRYEPTEEVFEYRTCVYHADHAMKLQSQPQIVEWCESFVGGLVNRVESYQNSGSNFVLHSIDRVTLQVQKSNKTKAGSYIETPKNLLKKRAIVNIKNKDDRCLLYCLCAHYHYSEVNNGNEAYSYTKYLKEIKEPEGIQYPINILEDIPIFEKLNNIKINVMCYNDNEQSFNYDNLKILYNSHKNKNRNVCNLLLLSDGRVNHFCWIKNLQSLFRNKANDEKRYPCAQCLAVSFHNEENLLKHQELCYENEAVATKLPEEGKNHLRFKNEQHKFKHPFSVYADFESTLKTVESNDLLNTQRYQEHEANSVGIKLNCIHSQYSKPIVHCSNSNPEEVLKYTVEKLEEYANYCYKTSKQSEKIYKVTKEENIAHRKALHCTECNTTFNEEAKKVLHHDHITGEFISSLCSPCNLKFQIKRVLPIYFHNLKGYDCHLIIKALNDYGFKSMDEDNITCIPNNEERYITFSKKIPVDTYKNKKGEIITIYYELRFLDSLAFLSSSLESLAENLFDKCKGQGISEYRKVFANVSQQFPDDKQFYLVLQKGIYPYDYISEYNKLLETKELPTIDQFYSKLNDCHCDEKDYERAKLVWNEFKCETLLDYHTIYLMSDVLLLADIFEAFRLTCLNIYGLDPAYYFTAPSLSWDAFLKHKTDEYKAEGKGNFEIELLTDIDMVQLFENSIRGGLSQISKRYAKANNKYMPETYNPKLKDEYLLYLDCNNLYGHSMTKKLPKKNFKWNDTDWTTEKIVNLDDDGKTGYLFEVDLHYPEDQVKREALHDHFNGYAPAAENLSITEDMLSEFQRQDFKKNGTKKLITTLNDKYKYGINYRLLKLFLSLGLELGTVHRVIEYEQEDYMKSYIMKNTNERQKATNDFEKDFYKLMNNSIFGKSLENVRKRINFRLVNNEQSALAIRNKRIKFTIFSSNLVGVHLCKQEVTLNKPIFIGQTILDDSKHLMYNFHYNFMLKKFQRKNIDLLFTDTDSLCYHIKNEDPYVVMKENEDEFDLANYPKDHFLYNPTNDKVIGKFKHDIVKTIKKGKNAGKKVLQITEFVGLRSKLYAYKTNIDNEDGKRCKGVKQCVVQNNITFQNYKQILFSGQKQNVKQNGFRTYKHTIYTETVEKTALSGNDDKCYIRDGMIETYTHGHYKIRNRSENK